jgi:hypothetical protein
MLKRKKSKNQHDKNNKINARNNRNSIKYNKALIFAIIPLILAVFAFYYKLNNFKDPQKASFKDQEPTGYKPQRIIAIGDLHGDFDNTVRTLRMAQVINNKNEWICEKTILVQTGDIVDRGDDTLKIYKFFQNLTIQASKCGGQLIQLLGNHEIMNLQGDLRYVTPGDITLFGGIDQRNYQWTEGWVYQYLKNLGISAKVGSTVFFHGGCTVKFAKLGIDKLNSMSKRIIEGESDDYDLFGIYGPLWYRGYALDPDYICKDLKRALEFLNATKMVVGHTTQPGGLILERCNNTFFVIDVGISRAYGGYLAALEIEDDKVTAIYPNKRVLQGGLAKPM